MKNKKALKISFINNTIVALGTFAVIICFTGVVVVGFLAVPIALGLAFAIFVVSSMLDGYAELIEKTSEIEELLRNSMIPQEEVLNKNVYSISQSLYTKNNYNDEFEDQLAINKRILATLKSIDEKLEPKTKSKKEK